MNNSNQIRHRLNQGLSGVTVSPQREKKLMEEIFGGKKVKRKLTYSLIFAIILTIFTISALAVIAWNQVFEKVIDKEAESGIILTWTTKEKIDLLTLLSDSGWGIPDEKLGILKDAETKDADRERIADELITEYLGRIDAVSHMDIIERVKGPRTTWSLEDKAWYGDLMRSKGLLHDSWYDLIPTDNEPKVEIIIETAKNEIISAFNLEKSDLDSFMTDISFFTYDLSVEARWLVNFKPNPIETAIYSVLLTKSGQITEDISMGVLTPENAAKQGKDPDVSKIQDLIEQKGPQETWSLVDKALYLGDVNALPKEGEVTEDKAIEIALKALQGKTLQPLPEYTVCVWYKLYDEYASDETLQHPYYQITLVDDVSAPYDSYSVIINPIDGEVLQIHTPDSSPSKGNRNKEANENA